MMDRRKFVQACTVLLGSGFLAGGCGGSDSTELSVDNSSLPDLSRNRWVSMPSTSFSVTHDTYGAIDMELTAIDDDFFTPESEQFSITLRGPELPLLDEGVYQVYNDTFGYVDLYLQPGTSAPGEQIYLAVFSILQT